MSAPSDLIPLFPHAFGQEHKASVNARTLYEFLELNPAVWARWVQRNIVKNSYAMEHTDWEGFQPLVENSQGSHHAGRPTVEYVLSLDFAKRLAMMTRSAKGEEARLYFLECERHVQQSTLPRVHDHRTEIAIQTLVRLDEAEHRIALMEQADRDRQTALLAMQAHTIEALQHAAHADAKADMALSSVHRMTVEHFIFANGLLGKFPHEDHGRISNWLRTFSFDNALDFDKEPVYGKPWPDENRYQLAAFSAWLRYEKNRPRQQTLLALKKKGRKD
jgi:phage anti-repressor protein